MAAVALLAAAALADGNGRPGGEAGDEEINRLVAQLGSGQYHRREEATQRLAAIGPPAVGPLVRALSSEDLEIRLRAANILAHIGQPAHRFLVERWPHVDAEGRQRLWRVLSEIARQRLDDNRRVIGIDLDIEPRDEGGERVAVRQARPNTPAQRAGLQAGDLLTKVNGMPLTGFQMLQESVQVFDSMTLEIVRNGQTVTVDVTVAEGGLPPLRLDDLQ